MRTDPGRPRRAPNASSAVPRDRGSERFAREATGKRRARSAPADGLASGTVTIRGVRPLDRRGLTPAVKSEARVEARVGGRGGPGGGRLLPRGRRRGVTVDDGGRRRRGGGYRADALGEAVLGGRGRPLGGT